MQKRHALGNFRSGGTSPHGDAGWQNSEYSEYGEDGSGHLGLLRQARRGAVDGNPPPRHWDYRLPGWYTWSNEPPSAKCAFWALAQPPNTSSIVNSFTLGKLAAYLAATFSEIGR